MVSVPIHLPPIQNTHNPQAVLTAHQVVQQLIRRESSTTSRITRPPREAGADLNAHSVLDRRYWTPQIGPPALAPPPGAPRPAAPPQSNSFSSNIVNKMGDLSLKQDATGGSGSKKDKDTHGGNGEKKEKKSLFKMKW